MSIEKNNRSYDRSKSFIARATGIHLLTPALVSVAGVLEQMISSLRRRDYTKSDDFVRIVEALGLTQDELNKKQKYYERTGSIFLIIGIGIFLMSCFIVADHGFFAFVNYFLASLVMFTFSVRMFFYGFLIRKRSLDYTMRAWLMLMLKGYD